MTTRFNGPLFPSSQGKRVKPPAPVSTLRQDPATGMWSGHSSSELSMMAKGIPLGGPHPYPQPSPGMRLAPSYPGYRPTAPTVGYKTPMAPTGPVSLDTERYSNRPDLSPFGRGLKRF